jgi:peptidoglycan/LPS O-acetylase OafA/YrhL
VAVLEQDLARPTRWPVLDGFRGLAVLTVVAYHAVKIVLESQDLVHPDPTAVAMWPLGLGRFSVDAFFVLSGFLIVTAWDRRPALGHFTGRRLRRLWPAYLVSVLVLVPLLAPEVLWSGRDLLALVTLQGYLVPGLTSSVNVPWWSLTTEVHFYLLVPLLAPLLHRRFGRWALLAAAIAVALWWWGPAHVELGMDGSLLPGRLPQFLLGALVGICVREDGPACRAWALARSRWLAVASAAGLLALGLYLGANGTYHRLDVPFDRSIEVLSGLLLAVLLFHVVVREEEGHGHDALARPSLRAAGLVSYSLYLWHYPILLATSEWLAVHEVPAMAIPATAIGLAATAAVTAASYRWIERPLLYRSGRRTMPEVGTPVPAVTRTFSTSST